MTPERLAEAFEQLRKRVEGGKLAECAMPVTIMEIGGHVYEVQLSVTGDTLNWLTDPDHPSSFLEVFRRLTAAESAEQLRAENERLTKELERDKNGIKQLAASNKRLRAELDSMREDDFCEPGSYDGWQDDF